MSKNFLYRIIILPSVLSCIVACTSAQNRTSADGKAAFVLPDIPSDITEPEQRAAYLVSHYWDNYDFADTALIACPGITEQAFVDFIDLLTLVPYDKAEQTIAGVMDAAMSADSMAFAHFAELSEKYLYDLDSPMRNEEYYIPVLQYIVSSKKIDDTNKIRSESQLDMAMKNRPGTIASDFTYTLKNDKEASLSDISAAYTILFFNNPDCPDCQKIKTYMANSPVLNGFLGDNTLTSTKRGLAILSIYPDTDLPLWLKAEYPKEWINGYDADRVISDKQLYDLKTIPTLYLLDEDKRVILKDTPVEVVETWLSDHAAKQNKI